MASSALNEQRAPLEEMADGTDPTPQEWHRDELMADVDGDHD